MMRGFGWFAVAMICLIAVDAGHGQTPAAPPFDPVGRWQFLHVGGAKFIARLTADQFATTDSEGGEHGIWRWERGSVRISYTDGWDDVLIRQPDGIFVKRSWGADADRCGPPTNQTDATRLSDDPGPPL
jgi:hypothetical protein